MDVEIFTLCDAATQDHGKLNMLGVFDSIIAKQFPVRHPQCAVAIRLRFYKSESGEHEIKIDFVDSDGSGVLPPIEGKLGVHFDNVKRDSVSTNLVFNLSHLMFEKPDDYAVMLYVDGEPKRSTPLYIGEFSKQQGGTL